MKRTWLIIALLFLRSGASLSKSRLRQHQGEEKERDLKIFKGMGTRVFMITFGNEDPDLEDLNITRISQPGIDGNPDNRYAWSSALDDNNTLYIGTLNEHIIYQKLPDYLLSIIRAPLPDLWNALVDGILRQWSGTPFLISKGAEIYRYDEKVFQLEYKASTEYFGFREMVNYQGNIYAAISNGPDGPYNGDPYDFSFYENGTGAKIFTNTEGQGFRELDDEGYLDNYDKSVRAMCASSYSGRLFIGTETYRCSKILIYDNSDPSSNASWTNIKFSEEYCTWSVSQCLDLGDGKMLFGTWGTLDYRSYLIDEKNNDTLTRVDVPRLFFHVSCGIMELRVFKGYLYVGVLSYVRGFALIRTNVTNVLSDVTNLEWERITYNGFAKEQKEVYGPLGRVAGNEYPWSSAEIKGIYFLGTFSLTTRGISFQNLDKLSPEAQLWASKDGMEWTLIQSEVFDKVPFMYGFRTMQATSDDKRLYIGAATNSYIPDI